MITETGGNVRSIVWGVAGLLLSLLPALLPAQQAPGDSTVRIVAGAHYRAGGIHRFFFGNHYRDLWTAPVTVEVLNLETYAGGLTPLSRGGGQQTRSLLFQAGDGRQFFVRSVDKNPTGILPEELRETFAASVLQDQISAANPAAPPVVSSLLDAAGVLHVDARLVVLPDDPRLGEFRRDFAGMLGVLELRARPGFAGSREIVNSDSLYTRLAADPAEQVDARAFLKARLMDLFLGDWDRHRGQWRWARIGADPGALWQPIPDDRDQAFVRFDGLLLVAARTNSPQLVKFEDHYPGMLGPTWNGRDLDRRFLTGLERPVWDSLAAVLRAALTDPVIEEAVRRLPPEYYARRGPELAAALKRRRDLLPEAAGRYYRHLAGQVDVFGTTGADVAVLTRLDRGDATVTLRRGGAVGAPYYVRRFHPGETHEVRVYLLTGDDSAVVRGSAGGGITLRVIGGPGPDRLADSSRAGGARLYPDGEGAPPNAPPRRDWGSRWISLIWLGGAPDVGLLLGVGGYHTNYGFRKQPYASRIGIRAAYATGAATIRAEFKGTFRRESSRVYTTLEARVSGIDILRFYGFGNETVATGSDRFYRVLQEQYSFSPKLNFGFGRDSRFAIGPIVKYASTELPTDRFIGLARPYGSDGFGQVGGTADLELEGRDNQAAPRRGARLALGGSFYPKAWDATRSFGEVHSEASTYLSAGGHFRPTLALRVGGQQVWGRYPFHEAAFIGGRATVRGWPEQRFAGDASLYGNAELRLHLLRYDVLVPGDLGIFGLADIGRVFLEGETSTEWHAGYGGGVSLAPLGRSNTFTIAVAKGKERTGVYFGLGFLY